MVLRDKGPFAFCHSLGAIAVSTYFWGSGNGGLEISVKNGNFKTKKNRNLTFLFNYFLYYSA